MKKTEICDQRIQKEQNQELDQFCRRIKEKVR